MPITGGEYKPTDIVDVANLQATFKDNNVQQEVAINYSEMELTPTYGEVTDLINNDWPTTKFGRYFDDWFTEWPDPKFKQPWDTLEPEYQPYRAFFEQAYNASAWSKAKNYADQERKDNEIRGNMTPAQWGYYISGSMLDPLTIGLSLITFGGAAMGRGLTIGQAAVRTGTATAGISTATEGILQLTDPMRSLDESLFSIAAGTVAGTLIGAGGQKVYNLLHNVKGQRNSADSLNQVITTQMREEVNLDRVLVALDDNVPLNNVTIPPPPKNLPVPARMAIEGIPDDTLPVLPPPRTYIDEAPTDFDEVTQVLDDWIDNPPPDQPFGTDTRDPANFLTTIKDETPLFSPFKPIVHNKVMISPVTTLMYNGVSPTFSRLGDMFGSNNIYKHGDYNATRYNGKTLREEIKREERGAFMIMSDSAAKVQYELSKQGTKMSIDDIALAAGKAARRNSDQTEFPVEVYALGQQFRKQLDTWKERGLEQGVLTDKNLVELENYVPRFWDMDAVSRYPARFRSKIKAWAIAKEYDLDDAGLDQLVVDIKDSLNRINAGEDHPMVFHISRKTPKSGHAQARRIDANDLDLEDFLVSDVRVLLDRYVRGVGADIIVREIFGKNNIRDINGLPMPKAQYDQGVREFDVALQALEQKVESGSGSAKRQYKRLEKKRAATIKAAENMLRGAMQRPEISRFPKLDSFARGLQGYSAVAGLGGVIQSAFPDAGNNVMQHGLFNMLASTPEFFKALPQIFSRNVAGSRRAIYWREHKVALDNLMSNRMMAVAGIEDASTYGVRQDWWHGTEVARKGFRIFLADRWNTGAKLLAGTAAERAIFRDVQKMAAGKLGKNRSAKLHQMGVTQDVANRIAANLKEHGKTKGLINWEKWDDETFQDLSRLLFRESEFQVVAPDGGEMPNGFNNMPGRLFMQYKTFMLSNTLKQTIPWSQKLFSKGDITVLAGLATLGGLAIWSRYVKDITKSFDKDSGFDIDQVNEDWANKTAADLAAIAVTDGALLSFLPALLGAADNFFNNELGEAVGMTPRKRFYSPGLGIESNMAGLGYADTLRAATWGAARAASGQQEYTARDLNKVRRSVPLQNTFYLQWLFDWGEQSIVDEFNLPESSSKKSKSRF